MGCHGYLQTRKLVDTYLHIKRISNFIKIEMGRGRFFFNLKSDKMFRYITITRESEIFL